MRPELMNALSLAYLGDAIFELKVREYLTIEKGIAKVNDLQKEAVKFVSANAQANFMNVAIENNYLTEEELAVYKRGRNTKGRSPKNMSVMTHNQSTGFECLIAHHYLNGNTERLEELFNIYKEVIESDKL